MAKRKMSKMQMDDHDDAHFSDNPAVRKPKRKTGGKARGGKNRSGRKSKR